MANNHFVYILLCNDKTYYTGYTTNISRRIKMHEAGKGAKYTRGRGPFQLMYIENCHSKSAALKREYEIKQMTRQEKERLIAKAKGCKINANTK